MLFSDFSGGNQRPHRGRSAGPNFSPMRNWGKNRLGRSPLRTSLGYEAVPASSLGSARHPCCGPCLCHHTRLPWAAGPMAGWFPPPGLPCPSGVPAAGHHHRTIGPAFFIIHYSLFIIHSSFIIILRAYSIPPRSETDSKPNSPHTPAPGTNPPPGCPPPAG